MDGADYPEKDEESRRWRKFVHAKRSCEAELQMVDCFAEGRHHTVAGAAEAAGADFAVELENHCLTEAVDFVAVVAAAAAAAAAVAVRG